MPCVDWSIPDVPIVRSSGLLHSVKYFNSASTFRTWLAKHHRTKRELLVGIHKKHTGTSSVSYPEALDVALCFGWIDGVRRRVDDDRYTIRFTPRLPRSE